MSVADAVLVALAGVGAGTINTIVGSGTLITFPTLLALGVPPVTANVSNNVGLVPGSLTGVWGYRRELRGQATRVLRLVVGSVLGGATGAVLLLTLPSGAFETIVPVLIGLGVLLVLVQPRLSARVARRREAREQHTGGTGDGTGGGTGDEAVGHHDARWVWPMVALTGVYGGYFGAAQGVLLMGVLGIGVPESLQRLNAVKNVLAAGVNIVAGLLFVVVADVDWLIVALIGAGSVVGGLIGSTVGRRLPAPVLRGVIVVVGVVALVALLR